MTIVATALYRLSTSLHELQVAVNKCDAARLPPAKASEPLKSIAQRICADAEMIDINDAVLFMDRISAQACVRARLIDQITKAIQEVGQ